MTRLPLIAGMWGTTHLSLYLLDSGPDGISLLDKRSGPGVSRMHGTDFETALFDAIGPWLSKPVQPEIILAGMVGSTLGWADAGYVACPVGMTELNNMTAIEARGRTVRIVSGLSCTNRLGAPDVMRGEETELLGLLDLRPDLRTGQHLVCIPGTHAKWVDLVDGTVASFCTSVAGELYAVLKGNGVLVPSMSAQARADEPVAFLDGVATARAQSGHFLNALFATRSRQIAGDLAPDQASDWLSGLIIGEDVRSALDLFDQIAGEVSVIGSDALASRYVAALGCLGKTADLVSSEAAAARGLWALAQQSGLVEADHG